MPGTALSIAVPASGVGAATDMSLEQPVWTFVFNGADDGSDQVAIEVSQDNVNFGFLCGLTSDQCKTITCNANFVRARRLGFGTGGNLQVTTSAASGVTP